MATIGWVLVFAVVLAWGVRSVLVPEFVSGRVVRRSRTSDTPNPISLVTANGASRVQVAADGLLIKQLVWAKTLDADFGRPFPLLAAIDDARSDNLPKFAHGPLAGDLEQLAQDLVTRSWSDLVLLMGQVDKARFDALCSTLEWEQRTRLNRPSTTGLVRLEMPAA